MPGRRERPRGDRARRCAQLRSPGAGPPPRARARVADRRGVPRRASAWRVRIGRASPAHWSARSPSCIPAAAKSFVPSASQRRSSH